LAALANTMRQFWCIIQLMPRQVRRAALPLKTFLHLYMGFIRMSWIKAIKYGFLLIFIAKNYQNSESS